MVYFKTPNAKDLVEYAANNGILCLALAADTIRLVAHLDVSSEQITNAITVFQSWNQR
jgi:acetylornithine/succinyldiaminopimelate/putrescine aminotransferase